MAKVISDKTILSKENCLIVTDLDGTLMDDNYDISPAISTLEWLKSRNIPIIPCTSKTASEVEEFREKYDLHDPYIVENGGAIYGNKDGSKETWEFILGRSYKELRPLLDVLAESIGYPLRALKDLSRQEIKSLTGLKGQAIDLACDRRWSVPFLNPKDTDVERIAREAERLCLTVLQGNRMSHLLSKGSHKGNAIIELKHLLNLQSAQVIALGDSPNDLPLLQVADVAIVVPGSSGPHPSLVPGIQSGNFILAPAPHAYGWSIAIRDYLNQRLDP